MVYLTFVSEFNAFHRMWNKGLSPEENQELFGKCANPSGHGHRYRVEVTVRAQVSRENPFVLKRPDIQHLRETVLAPKLEGANLDTIFERSGVSSGENVARAVWAMLREKLAPSVDLVSVKIVETVKNAFVYRGAGEIDRQI